MKLAKFNFAKDGVTLFINDQTSPSTPRPDEYSFQFEETISLTANSSLKDVWELSEPMQLVDIKAKIIDLSEVQIVTRKQLTMVEAMISDGKTTARLVLWEDQARNVQKGAAHKFQQVRIRSTEDGEKVFNTTKETVATLNNDAYLKQIQTIDGTFDSDEKTITVPKIEFIQQFTLAKACVKCNKHIQNSSENILKCEFCKYIMRYNECKPAAVVKIVVILPGASTECNELHLAVFEKTLIELLQTQEVFDAQFVCSHSGPSHHVCFK